MPKRNFGILSDPLMEISINRLSKRLKQLSIHNNVTSHWHLTLHHRGTKGIFLFFQKTRTLQSRGVVTLVHLFTIVIYGRN